MATNINTNRIAVIVALLFIGGFLVWLFFWQKPVKNKNGKTDTNTGRIASNQPSIIQPSIIQPSQPVSNPITEIKLTEDKKLDKVTIDPSTNQILSSKELTIEEAAAAVGGYANLCTKISATGYTNANGDPICSLVRGAS